MSISHRRASHHHRRLATKNKKEECLSVTIAPRTTTAGSLLLQPDSGALAYAKPDQTRADKITEELNELVRREVPKWRSRMQPKPAHAGFSNGAARNLKLQLPRLEQARFEGGAAAATTVARVKEDVSDAFRSQRVLTAVALNLPYTEVRTPLVTHLGTPLVAHIVTPSPHLVAPPVGRAPPAVHRGVRHHKH